MSDVTVRFLGTGEAFDGWRPNTSVLLEGSTTVLLDCGPTVPPQIWRLGLDANAIDILHLSHLHGDHVYGVPFLLARMAEDGRTRPLMLAGAAGTAEHVERVNRAAYGTIFDRLGFPVVPVVLRPGEPTLVGSATVDVAASHHSRPNHAIRVEMDGVGVGFSGDGAATADTRRLYEGLDLLVHEAFDEDGAVETHGSIAGAIEVARSAGAARLALVHISREIADRVPAIVAACDAGATDVIVPPSGHGDEPHSLVLRAG